MNINKRAVVAGGAAVALLIGGGLTFARWYDEASIGNENAEINSGVLKFDVDNLECSWADGGDNVKPGDIVVPGDTMECTGSSKIKTELKGKNLAATLTAVPTGKAADMVDDDFAVLKATIDGNSNPVTLTSADDGKEFEVGFSIYFKEFKDSEDNTTHEWENPSAQGSDESQWWKQDKQGEDFSFDAGDIKLQLVQNNR